MHTVCQKRDPVLVPSWVIKQFSRTSLPLKALLDLTQAQTVLSQEDLVVLLDLNENPMFVFGVPSIGMGLRRHWQRSAADQLRRLTELRALYQGSLDTRLYAAGPMQHASCSPASAGDATTDLKDDAPFKFQSVESELDPFGVEFVIVYPGHVGGPQSTQVKQRLRREYLKQFYDPTAYEVLAKDPVFALYLREL